MDNAIVSSADGAGGGGGGLPVSSTAQHEGEKRLTQPNVTETPQKVGDESSSSILKGNKPSSKIGSSGGSGIRAKDESSDAKKRKTARRKKKDDAAALSNRSRAGGVEGSGGHAASPSASRSISSAPVHAASAAAVRAERELEEQRANAEARRNDAAWLNGGVIPVALEQRKHGWIREAGGQHSGGQKGFLAEEIAIVERSLKVI